MANFIQSRVYLIHKTQATKPTDDKSPTRPSGDETPVKPKAPSNNASSLKNSEEEGVLKLLGSASVQRRLLNIGSSVLTNIISHRSQDLEFKYRLAGDNRMSEKLQQDKQKDINIVQQATRGASMAITAVALSNPLILGAYFLSMFTDMANRLFTQNQAIQEYNAKREKELFESQYRRDRLVKTLYNRR